MPLTQEQTSFLLEAEKVEDFGNGYFQSFENGLSFIKIEHQSLPNNVVPNNLQKLSELGYLKLNFVPDLHNWRSPRQQHLLSEFSSSKGLECYESLPDKYWQEFQALCLKELGYAPKDSDLSYVWIQTWYFQLTEKAIDFCIHHHDRR